MPVAAPALQSMHSNGPLTVYSACTPFMSVVTSIHNLRRSIVVSTYVRHQHSFDSLSQLSWSLLRPLQQVVVEPSTFLSDRIRHLLPFTMGGEGVLLWWPWKKWQRNEGKVGLRSWDALWQVHGAMEQVVERFGSCFFPFYFFFSFKAKNT